MGLQMNLFTSIDAFIQVAGKGNVAGTARQLSFYRSASSKLVAHTEDILGTLLFNRNTRSLTLEDHLLLKRWSVILSEMDAAWVDISGRHAAPYLASGGLVMIQADIVSKEYQLHLLWPTNKHAMLRLREFIDYFHRQPT